MWSSGKIPDVGPMSLCRHCQLASDHLFYGLTWKVLNCFCKFRCFPVMTLSLLLEDSSKNVLTTVCAFAEIRSWWEVPCIAHFCSLFRAAFGLTDFEIEVTSLYYTMQFARQFLLVTLKSVKFLRPS